MTATGTTLPQSRKHHTTTLHPDGHTLVMIGGEFFNSTGSYLLNDVWTLDTSNRNNYIWTQPNISGIGLYRSNHSAVLIGDQIWVIAGTNASAKAVDIQLLNTTSWKWSYGYTSTFVSENNSLSKVGGIGGLIGILAGVIIAIAIGAFLIFRYCYKKRNIKPANNNNNNNKNSFADPQDYSYHDDHLDYNNNNNSKNEALYHDSSTHTGSKITSRPSVSTASNPNMGEYPQPYTIPPYEGYEDNSYDPYSRYYGDSSSSPLHHIPEDMQHRLSWDGKPPILPAHHSFSS